MKLAAFAFSLAIFLSCRALSAAESIDDAEVLAAMRARDAGAARAARVAAYDLRLARAACQGELSGRRIPAACYSMLESESRLAGHGARSALWLEQACEDAAARVAPEQAQDLARRARALPQGSRCRAAIRRRLGEIAYILAKKDPAALVAAPPPD
jgi:hypothetical protein